MFILRQNRTIINGRNNKVCFSQAYLSNVRIQINGNDNEIEFGKGAVVKNIKIRVEGSNHKLSIGESCKINAGEFVMFHKNGNIAVGKGTFINSANFYCTESAPIRLGDKSMLAWDIEMHSGDFHPIYDCETNMRLNPAKEINIGSHVWIGAHVQILKGASIGENSVIGMRSVVTRNIPANCIAAGTPAKIMRNNIIGLSA